jgi:hypothetical protein
MAFGTGKQYTIPPFGSSGDRICGWLREAVQEGDAWLGTQKPGAEWDGIISRIGSSAQPGFANGQSTAEYNKTERLTREIVASLGSFQHVGEVKPVSDRSLYPQAGILSKLDQAWWKNEESYAASRAWLQNAVALGTGYGWQIWDKHFHGPHRGDVRLTALAPTHVTFVQLPNDHDIQRAYAVIIREELPINLARRIYMQSNRAFADALKPDRDSPSWLAKGLRKVQEFLSPALRVRGTRPGETTDAAFPTVDIFHVYVLDGAVNETGYPIIMGPSGANWSYTVPSIGAEIPTGQINRATGAEWTRPAEPGDCLMFPLRRYSIFSRTTDIVGYDGTSPWWHGMAPLARFRFNDWPWEALGRSCVGMIGTMEQSYNAILQGVEDSIAARLDPPAIYNDNLVGKPFADAFNPRKAGARAGAPLDQGDVIKFPVPPEFYNIPAYIMEYLNLLDGRMEYLTGAQDLTAIAKAKQLPSPDSIEKLLEMAGPLVQDMVRSVVMPLKQLGTMRLAYFLQFYTSERIITATDDDPINKDTGEPDDWTFSPDKLLPYQVGETGQSRSTRVRQFISEFRYSVSQSGISEINRMTTKLFFLQLMKIPGFPMDWWTYAKVAQLPRFGAVPEGTNTMLERYIAQLHMQRDLQTEAAQEMAQATGGGPAPSGGGGPEGRPNVNSKAPHIVQKDGGARSTVATS